ncbi:MAG: hypothetical protein ACPL8I_07605, partial [Chloroflexaceae bacterium]
LGVSCTAAIATDRARRGADRAVVAARSASNTRIYELFLDKERRDRAAEEELISRLVVLAIAEGCGVGQMNLALGPEEALRVTHYPAPS